MPTLSPAVAQRRAKVAGLTVGVRTGKRQLDDAELAAAKCDLAWERLAEHAESVVADWPTPTPEQLHRVVALLRAGRPGGSTAPSETRRAVVAERIAELGGGAV